jgi:hypothetical protein
MWLLSQHSMSCARAPHHSRNERQRSRHNTILEVGHHSIQVAAVCLHTYPGIIDIQAVKSVDQGSQGGADQSVHERSLGRGVFPAIIVCCTMKCTLFLSSCPVHREVLDTAQGEYRRMCSSIKLQCMSQAHHSQTVASDNQNNTGSLVDCNGVVIWPEPLV